MAAADGSSATAAQAMRRFGSHVTVIESGPQLAGREDPDVGATLVFLLGQVDTSRASTAVGRMT
jgi:pyruvate/2-oxoglutarate dehydrogenase complex dihydrolipoamide dehydrogenase (E3) component